LRTDQLERRVRCQSFGVVEVFIARQAAVDRLSQQIAERKLLVQVLSRVAQLFLDELLQTQWLIQLVNQNATIGIQWRSLEIDLQGSIERELERACFVSPHRVCTSKPPQTFWSPTESWLSNASNLNSSDQIGNGGLYHSACIHHLKSVFSAQDFRSRNATYVDPSTGARARTLWNC